MPFVPPTLNMLLGLTPPPCRICGERGEMHEIRARLPDGFTYRMICTFCGAHTGDSDNKRRVLEDWAKGDLLPPAYEEIPP
jgi:hypothetical protein